MEFRRAYDPFRALGSAWKLVQVAPLGILTGAFLLFLMDMGGPSFSFNYKFEGETHDAAAVVLAAIGCVLCLTGIGLFVLDSLLRVGFATVVERAAVRGEDRIGDLFRSRGRLLSMLFAQVLWGILMLLALAPFVALAAGAALLGMAMGGDEAAAVFGFLCGLLCIPGYVYVLLGLSLIPEAVAFERLWPFAAVARSWSLVRGNRLWLFWFTLVKWTFTLVGLCFFCVGILATWTYAYVFSYEAYLRLIRDDQDTWVVDGGSGGPLLTFDPDDGSDPDR